MKTLLTLFTAAVFGLALIGCNPAPETTTGPSSATSTKTSDKPVSEPSKVDVTK